MLGGAYGAAELVGCLGAEQWVNIETCHYYGPDINRYEYQVSIRVIVAQTGQVVAQGSVSGTSPRYCRQQEPYNLTTLSGNHVTLDDVRAWLQSVVVRKSNTPVEAAGRDPR